MLHTMDPKIDESLRRGLEIQRRILEREKYTQVRNYNASVGKTYRADLGLDYATVKERHDALTGEVCEVWDFRFSDRGESLQLAESIGKGNNCVPGVPCVDGGGHGSFTFCGECDKLIR